MRSWSKMRLKRQGSGHLFAKYAVISLLPVVLLGLASAASLRSEAKSRGLAEGKAEAGLVAETAVDPLLNGSKITGRLKGQEFVNLTRLARRAITDQSILRLRIHNLAGQVVFSDDGSGFGGEPDDEAIEAAEGHTVVDLTHLNADSNDHGPLGKAAVEVYEPLIAPGAQHQTVGVLELYLPYAPINADVTASIHRLYLDLVAGLTLLYLALFAITVSVSRGLRRQVAVNQAQAELLRASELEHRLLFEENPQPMLAYDRHSLQIVAVSNAAVESYGYTREEFLAMTIKDVRPPEDLRRVLSHLDVEGRNHRSGASGTHQTRHQYKDGTIIDVEISGDDVMLNGRDCRIVLCQDVTARNQATADLAIARDDAIEASNMKSAFLANVSHEIRTPMNGVIGMNELLLDTGLSSEQRGYAEQVSRSGEQMLRIINDILDISKIETGQLELDLTDVALHDTIEHACAVAGIEANAKGLDFDVVIDPDVPKHVRADSGRLRQIILNLVANAVKFTATGGVTVRASVANATDNAATIRVAVTDSGIGIDPTALDTMFEPFTQADSSTTRTFGGTGLGLAIARELTDLMSGTIGAESEPGRGSTFWFEVTLPLAAPQAGSNGATGTPKPAAAPRAPGTAAAPLGPDSPIVLVAEDTPVNQIVAIRALQRCGCRAHAVNDGYEALEALLSQRYDAILMDCQMPEMDGYQTTGELRRREVGGRRTPVIAMTAHAMKGDFEKCIAAGMDDYVSKPLRHQALAEVLERWLPARPAAAEDDGDTRRPLKAASSR
jgi:PAS domain S-box-containing protein